MPRNLFTEIPGPILVMGASGFVGANLFRAILRERADVVGTFFSGNLWRLHDIPSKNMAYMNIQDPISIKTLLLRHRPKVVFDCSAFGAYSFEQDVMRIHSTNYLNFFRFMELATSLDLFAYVHAGSSSEYGLNASAPAEDATLIPNSHYAVSKAAISQAITYYGKVCGVSAVNLRLYSVYGSYEDSSRLIPVLCSYAQRGELPLFAQREISRDFVHIDDIIAAFSKAALAAPYHAGESFNIGTGMATNMERLAELTQRLFAITMEPMYSATAGRAWDVYNWHANPEKAERALGWKAKIGLEEGLTQTYEWWKAFLSNHSFSSLTKKGMNAGEKRSLSAIVACYRDNLAIPIMYERLTKIMAGMGLDYEIIFVNDCSPDDSEERIREISANDPHVIGITHSRNFGSQAAFRSGMELCTKEACVLLDGDLQDPPELIEKLVEKWREGADVVYGRRVRREMPRLLEMCYKSFYKIFSIMSDIAIPENAGDFSLIDRQAMYWMLQCAERDSFLRGLRAYVGFKQIGVDYVRPERLFGHSTNNWMKNIGWAKKAIFSFSQLPLHFLTTFGAIAFSISCILVAYGVGVRLLASESVPRGMTFISLLIMFFGSSSLLGLGLLGEYLGKIFEETKARPPFIRKHLVSKGVVEIMQGDNHKYGNGWSQP